jgi:uncharacterized protein (TIGR02145 family)
MHAGILYLDDDGVLQVGTWGVELTASNYLEKMLWFKFGSVVGFDLTGNFTSGSMTAIKFNPSTVTPTDYGTIPVYAYDSAIRDVSASTWHNSTNVPLGKGDPCRLVGLTAAQVKAGSIDSGQYRLPTNAENVAFVGISAYQSAGSAYYTWTAGSPGVGTFPAGNAPGISLPAAGFRTMSGSVYSQGTEGRFWSSTVANSTSGYRMYFNSTVVYSTNIDYYAVGYAVRCVRQ